MRLSLPLSLSIHLWCCPSSWTCLEIIWWRENCHRDRMIHLLDLWYSTCSIWNMNASEDCIFIKPTFFSSFWDLFIFHFEGNIKMICQCYSSWDECLDWKPARRIRDKSPRIGSNFHTQKLDVCSLEMERQLMRILNGWREGM